MSKANVVKTFESIFCSFHEAGHAIFALRRFMQVTELTLYQNKKTMTMEGLTKYNIFHTIAEVRNPILQKYMVQADIGIAYAGLIAEKHQFGLISGLPNLPRELRGGAFYDTKNAYAHMQRYQMCRPGKDRLRYKHEMKAIVKSELLVYWSDVVLLAHELLEHEVLSYASIKKLLLTKSEHSWKKTFQNIETIPSLDESNALLLLSPYLHVFDSLS